MEKCDEVQAVWIKWKVLPVKNATRGITSQVVTVESVTFVKMTTPACHTGLPG